MQKIVTISWLEPKWEQNKNSEILYKIGEKLLVRCAPG